MSKDNGKPVNRIVGLPQGTAPIASNSKSLTSGSVVKRLADAICQGVHFAQDLGGRLCRYVDGVYRPKGEDYVRRSVKRLLNEWNMTKRWSPSLASSVVEYVRVDASELWKPTRRTYSIFEMVSCMFSAGNCVLTHQISSR